MSAVIDERQRIEAALSCIPADLGRDDWVRIGAALKHEQGDSGFELFDRWSQDGPSYDAASVRDTWRSLSSDAGIGIGTLFHYAKQHGFDPQLHKAEPVDSAELERRRAEREALSRREDEKRARARRHALTLVKAVWSKALVARDDHPYLTRKGVKATAELREIDLGKLVAIIGYTPKSDGVPLQGRVLIALVHVGPSATSIEMIDESGRKSALKGGEKSGGCWATGKIADDATVVYVCEGVSTALSISECTGDIAVAALTCGNLTKVAEALRASHPNACIVICGDIGRGSEKAEEAALAIGGAAAFPDFGQDRQENQTDFNDLHVACGADAVKTCIAAAVASSAATAAASVVGDQPDSPTNDPAALKRKRVRSSDGCIPPGFTVTDRGVFYEDDDGTPHWICSELHVRALVRDRASENWGRLLEWKDADQHSHVWALPMEMLRSDGADMRGELARLGLDIAPGAKARNKLTEYVITSKPKARGRCVTRTGWYEGAFVFPDRTVGAARERVIFQAETVARAYSQSGTLAEWQQGVARYCPGNSRLLLAVSTAFASMLLQFSGQESGGLNFVGDSSTGKTTALRAACSVFGGKDYMQRWRATANGLEGLAALHNDTLLVLDELAQVDAREAGEIAYMLANGSGKARAGRSGAARARQTWQLLFLSAGEIGLSQHMQAVGKKTKAGQEVRLVEIPADAGAGFGLFESLHGMPGGAALSSAINEAAVRRYGTPAIAFLDALCSEIDEIEPWLKRETSAFLSRHLPDNANGQAHRVCQRFGLIGLAGEYATASGITGWEPQQALQAAADCFEVWMENRGGSGNQERSSILSHVKAFFESHEESRFSDLADGSDRPTINRAGFRRSTETGIEYLVLPEVFKREICSGFDPKSVARNLIDAGWVRPSSDGKSQRSERLPGKGTTRVYVFTSALWEAQ